MTTTEALDQLSAEIPDRTFLVSKQAGHYIAHGSFRRMEYMVSVHPGFDGSKCQQFTSPEGFEKPVADCLALAKSVAATPNEE